MQANIRTDGKQLRVIIYWSYITRPIKHITLLFSTTAEVRLDDGFHKNISRGISDFP